MPAVDGQLFVETEATPGTYDAPEGTDAILVEGFEWSKAGPGIQQRNKHLGTQERTVFPYKPPSIFANVKFSTELRAQTDAVTIGELDRMWKSAGFGVTVGATTVYSQQADPNAAANALSLSYLFEESVDGNFYSGAGMRLGWEIAGAWNKAPLVNWVGVSSYIRPADQGALTAPTYQTQAPFVVLKTTGSPFRFHSYDMIVSDFSVRGAVKPKERPSMGNALTFGYKWPAFLAWGDGDAVQIQFTMELVDQTAFAAWSKFEAPAGGLDGEIIFEAGARTLTLDCNSTVFDAPARVKGQPNMWRITGWVFDFDLVYA